MRTHLRELVCLSVLLTAAAGTAAAEERLVMPFACRADGGRVQLTPGPSQFYPVVGAHERRNFSACPPMGPGRCRNYDLHRFEIDCSGAKVSWLSMVAALAPWTDRPNPIRGGRMSVEVGPRYSSAPCRVPVPYGPPGFYGPRGPYGAPGFYRPRYMVVPCPGGQAPRQMVNLPVGFAPLPARLVSFTSVPDAVAQAEIEAAPPPLPVRKERPNPAPPSPPAQTAKEQESSAAPTQLAANIAAKESDPGPSPHAVDPTVAESETTGAIPVPVSASARRNMIGAVGLGIAALLLFSTALLLSRRRSRALAFPLSREPVESGTLYRATTPEPFEPTPRMAHAETPPPKPKEDEWLPSTIVEALHVLGASPETGAEMLKQLVKGLRRRWHPDHALDEEDRHARERKLKQINVAWDIVNGKRRVRRPIRSRAA